MAHKGPRPQPTKLKLLKGNPGRRPLNANEPKPSTPADVPQPPEWLEPYALNEWKTLAPVLHGLGLLTAADTTFFSAYCQSYARWRAAEEWLSEHGGTIVLRDKDGKVRSVVRAPQAVTAQAALADMNRYGSQFGLSPSSRTSIGGAEPAKPENKFTALRLGLVKIPNAMI